MKSPGRRFFLTSCALLATSLTVPFVVLLSGKPHALSTASVRLIGTKLTPLALGLRIDCDHFHGKLTDFNVSNLRIAYTSDGWFRVPRKFDGTVSVRNLRVALDASDAEALFSSPIAFVKQVLAFDVDGVESAEPQRALRIDALHCQGVEGSIRLRESSPTPPPNVLVRQLELADVRLQVADWLRHDPATVDRQIPLPDIALEHASMRDVSSRKPLGAVLFRSRLLMHVGERGVIGVDRDDEHKHITVNVSNVPFGFVRAYARPPLTMLDQANVSVALRLDRPAQDWTASGEVKLDHLSLHSGDADGDEQAATTAAARAYFNSLDVAQRIPPIPFEVALSGTADDETNAENFVKRLAIAIAAEIGIRGSVAAAKSGVQFLRNQLEFFQKQQKQ